MKASIRRATEYARPAEPEERVITYGPLSLYVDGYRATKQEREIKLTSTEFELLKLFMTNPNRVFTKPRSTASSGVTTIWATRMSLMSISADCERRSKTIPPTPSILRPYGASATSGKGSKMIIHLV